MDNGAEERGGSSNSTIMLVVDLYQVTHSLCGISIVGGVGLRRSGIRIIQSTVDCGYLNTVP